MTPVQLTIAGQLLFGSQGDDWRGPFCERYLISPHTLRRILAGDREVPEGLAAELVGDAQKRALDLTQWLIAFRDAG